MLTEKRHEIAGLISLYPMIYCAAGIVITQLFKKPIILWFEVILYTDEEQEAEDRRRARNQEFEDLRELTLNDEDEEDGALAGGARNNALVRRVVKLKTYSFKKPQFMKKLTNTYFKKSKQSEKAVILHKELTSQKLHFSMHRKSTKSLSEPAAGDGPGKLQKLTKPFTEDMIELPEKQNPPNGTQAAIIGTADGPGASAKHPAEAPADSTPDSSRGLRLR